MNSAENIRDQSEVGAVSDAFAERQRKERIGQVISTKMEKTCVVQTITRAPHQRFGKIIKHRKRFYVHDELNRSRIGDIVKIAETRPISKMKRWRLVQILKS